MRSLSHLLLPTNCDKVKAVWSIPHNRPIPVLVCSAQGIHLIRIVSKGPTHNHKSRNIYTPNALMLGFNNYLDGGQQKVFSPFENDLYPKRWMGKNLILWDVLGWFLVVTCKLGDIFKGWYQWQCKWWGNYRGNDVKLDKNDQGNDVILVGCRVSWAAYQHLLRESDLVDTCSECSGKCVCVWGGRVSPWINSQQNVQNVPANVR